MVHTEGLLADHRNFHHRTPTLAQRSPCPLSSHPFTVGSAKGNSKSRTILTSIWFTVMPAVTFMVANHAAPPVPLALMGLASAKKLPIWAIQAPLRQFSVINHQIIQRNQLIQANSLSTIMTRMLTIRSSGRNTGAKPQINCPRGRSHGSNAKISGPTRN